MNSDNAHKDVFTALILARRFSINKAAHQAIATCQFVVTGSSMRTDSDHWAITLSICIASNSCIALNHSKMFRSSELFADDHDLTYVCDCNYIFNIFFINFNPSGWWCILAFQLFHSIIAYKSDREPFFFFFFSIIAHKLRMKRASFFETKVLLCTCFECIDHWFINLNLTIRKIYLMHKQIMIQHHCYN